MDQKPDPAYIAGEMLYHGIQNERSDMRAHVCPVAFRVYVFRTSDGKIHVEHPDGTINTTWPEKIGGQTRVRGPTYKGRVVPVEAIAGCLSVEPPEQVWKCYPIYYEMSTHDKGEQATAIVFWMVNHGWFPLPDTPTSCWEELRREPQINGTDIVVELPNRVALHVQVKCDYPGGERHLGGSGNLFLQTHECNPRRVH